MRWRGKRTAFAAWLGLLALAIQAVVPLLVAAEIAFAAKAGDGSVFELCVFGHVHAAPVPDAEGGGTPSNPKNADLASICPICVALHASPVFIAVVVAALPLPAFREVAAGLPEVRRAPPPTPLAAYRSRAPPIA